MPVYRIILLAVGLLGTIIATQPSARAEDESALKGLLIRGRMLAVIPQSSADISGIGGTTDISNAYVPELDLSWFFTKNIAVEAIAAITKHDVKATGTSIGSVLLQYHHPFANGFKPYVGAGVNYTVFFNEDAPGGTVTNINYDNTFGWALQVGADYMLNEHWLVNVDLKKLFINTDVSINNGAIKADVDINPWIVGVGLGYRF